MLLCLGPFCFREKAFEISGERLFIRAGVFHGNLCYNLGLIQFPGSHENTDRCFSFLVCFITPKNHFLHIMIDTHVKRTFYIGLIIIDTKMQDILHVAMIQMRKRVRLKNQ